MNRNLTLIGLILGMMAFTSSVPQDKVYEVRVKSTLSNYNKTYVYQVRARSITQARTQAINAARAQLKVQILQTKQIK